MSWTSAEELGYISSIAGSGVLFGGILVSIIGSPGNRIQSILVVFLIQGITMLSAVLEPSKLLISSVGFLYMMGIPIISSKQRDCSTEFYSVIVPPFG